MGTYIFLTNNRHSDFGEADEMIITNILTYYISFQDSFIEHYSNKFCCDDVQSGFWYIFIFL